MARSMPTRDHLYDKQVYKNPCRNRFGVSNNMARETVQMMKY